VTGGVSWPPDGLALIWPDWHALPRLTRPAQGGGTFSRLAQGSLESFGRLSRCGGLGGVLLGLAQLAHRRSQSE
jgi:hypothetical protein